MASSSITSLHRLTSSTPHVIVDDDADQAQTHFATATMDHTRAISSHSECASLPAYSCTCCGGTRPKVVVILPPSLEAQCDQHRVEEVVRLALANDKLTIKEMDLHFTWAAGLLRSSAEEEPPGVHRDAIMPQHVEPLAVADATTYEMDATGSIAVKTSTLDQEQDSDHSFPLPLDQAADSHANASPRYEEGQQHEDAAAVSALSVSDIRKAESMADLDGASVVQELSAAVPLPDSENDVDDHFDRGGSQLGGWSQVELVSSGHIKTAFNPFPAFDNALAQHVPLRLSDRHPPVPAAVADQPDTHGKTTRLGLDTPADDDQVPTLNNTPTTATTATSSVKPTTKLKLGTDLFQIIVDNMSPDAADSAIRALVPPDLKPARVVIPPARLPSSKSHEDGGSSTMVRGAMFDFTSRMDAITFWNSVRKSYAERSLTHLTLPDVDMTFWARPGISALLEQEELPHDYEYKLQDQSRRPKTFVKQAAVAPFMTIGTPPRRPSLVRRASSVPVNAPSPTGFYTPPARHIRPPGIFIGSLIKAVTANDVDSLVPQHLKPCQIQVHPVTKLGSEGILVGRVTISVDELAHAAALFKYFRQLNREGGMDHLMGERAEAVVVACMPEVRHYTPPTPLPADEAAATSRAASSRGGSTQEDDDADSAVVRNSPLITNGRAAREQHDEGVVAYRSASSSPRGSFVVRIGSLNSDVSLADIQALVPPNMSPTAMLVPRESVDGGVGHVRVYFETEPEAIQFGEHLKDLKRENEETLVKLAAAGLEATVSLFSGAERDRSHGEKSEASLKLWWPAPLAQPAKVQSPVDEQAPQVHAYENKSHLADEAMNADECKDRRVDQTKQEQVKEAVGSSDQGSGGWDSVEVASAFTSWMDQPTASGHQDDFAGVQAPVQQVRNRTKPLAPNMSGDLSSGISAGKPSTPATSSTSRRSSIAAPAISPAPKLANVHVNNLHPDITLEEFLIALPSDIARPLSIKMIAARSVGAPTKAFMAAGANLLYKDGSDAAATFERLQEMIRAGDLTSVSAPNTRVTVAVFGVKRGKDEQQQEGNRAASQQRNYKQQGRYDSRASSVQSRRGSVGTLSQPAQQHGTQDMRAQSVQPSRGGVDRYDPRVPSVQRFRPDNRAQSTQRPNKWSQMRGMAAAAESDASKLTRSGRPRLTEPIAETPAETPKAAPYATHVIHPPWAKAPPSALPTVGPSIAAPSSSAFSSSPSSAPTRSTAKTSFFTNVTTIKLHCVHLRHLSDEVTDNMLHYLIPNHWAGDQQPSAVEFKPPTETEEGSGIFKRQAKYFFNESKDARAFVDFIREKDTKGKLARLKQDPSKPLVVSASHAPVCVPPTAIFLYPGQTF